MLLHATACYCMLLHATACYCMLLLSTLHDAIVGACEVVKTSEQKVHLATSVVVLFFRASALACAQAIVEAGTLEILVPQLCAGSLKAIPKSLFAKMAFSLSTILCAPRLTKHVDEIGWILPLSRCCISTQDVCREKHMEHLVSCVQVL